MASIEIPDVDLSTAEGAKKGLADIHAAAKALRDENGELRGNVAKMTADLVEVSRKLGELQNAAAMPSQVLSVDDSMGLYVRDAADGRSGKPELRWVGGYERGHGQDESSWQPGLLDDEPQTEWQKRLQMLNEQKTFVRRCTTSGKSPISDAALARHLRSAPASLAPFVKTFADASGVGASFIPDTLSPDFEREYMLNRRVEALFPVYPMGGKELRIPFLTSGLRPYKKVATSTDDPAQYGLSSIAEALRSFTVAGLAVRTQIDEDTEEDAIIAALPFLRGEVISAISDGVEDAIINGDTTASHGDTGLASWDIAGRWGSTGLGGSTDHRRVWVGLRHRAIAVSNTTDQGAAETTAGFQTAIGKLASPHGLSGNAVNPQLVCVVSPLYFLKKMLGFTEVLTVDKFGPRATVLTGQLASLMGVPLIPSEFMDDMYNASGIYDNSTKTKGAFAIFNRSRFMMGNRRAVGVDMDRDITRGIKNLVATRRTLLFTVDSATKKNVHLSYNLTGVS